MTTVTVVSRDEYHRLLARDMREDALVAAIVRLAADNGWLAAVAEMAFATGDRRVERRYCADHAESMLRAVTGMPE